MSSCFDFHLPLPALPIVPQVCCPIRCPLVGFLMLPLSMQISHEVHDPYLHNRDGEVELDGVDLGCLLVGNLIFRPCMNTNHSHTILQQVPNFRKKVTITPVSSTISGSIYVAQTILSGFLSLRGPRA